MRYGTQEQERLLALSDSLLEEVKRELANIDLLFVNGQFRLCRYEHIL